MVLSDALAVQSQGLRVSRSKSFKVWVLKNFCRMLQSNDFFTPLTNEREIITALEDWSRVGFFKKKELGIDECKVNFE